MQAIINGTIYTPSESVADAVVLIAEGHIRALGGIETEIPPEAQILDARKRAIVPGLIDIHTFGCLGAQLARPERVVEDLDALSRNVAQFGVTGFLISLPMGTLDEICAMLTAVAEAIPQVRDGARCLGIHLEGPYLDPLFRGAFPKGVLRSPAHDEIAQVIAAAHGQLRMVTLAPNLPGAIEAARQLQENGIMPSLGHTGATFDLAHGVLAPDGPFGMVTHFFNAMTGLHHRNPGVVGAVLASDVPAMLICDGEHVHPAVVEILLRAKTPRRVVLVTDAMALAGMPDGEGSLFGQTVYVRHGRATLDNGTLAGSVLTLNCAVLNALKFGKLTFAEAVTMATLNPAQVLNLAGGTLSVGGDSDLAVLDHITGEVAVTMVRGKIVYRREV